jgi:hypothetical protein
VDPRASLDNLEKKQNLPPTGIRTPAVRPITKTTDLLRLIKMIYNDMKIETCVWGGGMRFLRYPILTYIPGRVRCLFRVLDLFDNRILRINMTQQ